MTTALIFVVGMAIVAGVVYVMMRMLRSHHQLIERRREARRAEGSVGPGPDDYIGRSGGFARRRLTQGPCGVAGTHPGVAGTPSTLWAYRLRRHLLMKPALICFAVVLLVGVIGCNREHDKIADAPRTESDSSVAGWTDVSTSGIALRFPDDWELIDLTREGFEQAADRVFGSDPKFAELRSQASDRGTARTVPIACRLKRQLLAPARSGSGICPVR